MKTTAKLTVQIQELHNLKRELINKSAKQAKLEVRIACASALLAMVGLYFLMF